MTGFGVLMRKELLEQWRTWRMLVVGIVFAIFGIGSPILARYTPELVKALASDQLAGAIPTPTITDAIVQFQKNLGQTGILAAILLAMGSVAVEKERGTAALLLTKPASLAARSSPPSWRPLARPCRSGRWWPASAPMPTPRSSSRRHRSPATPPCARSSSSR